MVYGYALVSTKGPTLDSQLEALEAAGCEKIFREQISGAKADRPQFTKLLTTIGKDDVLIVSRLDRLARSTLELLAIVQALAQRGATFRSLHDHWADTTATPLGSVLLKVLGGLAEFERELLRARTGDGRTRAMARGQHMGRPAALNSEQRQLVAKALAAGTTTQADLARQYNVSQSTISRLAETTRGQVAEPLLDPATERATKAFLRHIADKYPVLETILYGSRARRTHTDESDADLAVVIPGKPETLNAAGSEMAGIAFDVLMETGILVHAVPLSPDHLERPETFSNPALIHNIKRDGLRL